MAFVSRQGSNNGNTPVGEILAFNLGEAMLVEDAPKKVVRRVKKVVILLEVDLPTEPLKAEHPQSLIDMIELPKAQSQDKAIEIPIPSNKGKKVAESTSPLLERFIPDWPIYVDDQADVQKAAQEAMY
ncbi:hypothetical protein ACH5RR_008621 [Cinchona calisaya]|uniref:Uncharacterized protein n=1 Tax=Cinchona calisaya TaxID=153742 RepID=A0ABD3AC90_9GENT